MDKGDVVPPKKPAPKKKAFLTVPETADELEVSERHIWREIQAEKLKAHHFGGCTRISRDDLDELIRRSRG